MTSSNQIVWLGLKTACKDINVGGVAMRFSRTHGSLVARKTEEKMAAVVTCHAPIDCVGIPLRSVSCSFCSDSTKSPIRHANVYIDSSTLARTRWRCALSVLILSCLLIFYLFELFVLYFRPIDKTAPTFTFPCHAPIMF